MTAIGRHDQLAPLVHIGYPKAGSTSVQAVFGDPSSGFLPHMGVRHRTPNEVKNPGVVDYLVHCHDFEFDAGHLRRLAHESLGGIRALDKLPVVSSERLAGHWISGGYDSRTIADRIRLVWPGARILIVFREQKAMIDSVYRQYVKKGGGRRFDQLLEPKGHGHGRRPGFSLRFFKYDQLVGYYRDLFGADRVLALPLEMLRATPVEFFDRIVRFARAGNTRNFGESVPYENVGIDAYTASRKRLLNAFLEKDNINDYSIWCNSLTRRPAKLLLEALRRTASARKRRAAETALKRRVATAVDGYYARSNANLERLTDLNLEDYGYEVARSGERAAAV